jgi:hypothetical protein
MISGTTETSEPVITRLNADVAPPLALAWSFHCASPTVSGYHFGSESITSGRK